MVLCIIVMLILHNIFPIKIIIASSFNILGILAILAGLLVCVIGVLTFVKSKTNLEPHLEPDKFVTGGIFKYSRNPMYLGILFFTIGIWFFIGSVSSVLGLILYILLIDHVFIKKEEKVLSRKFGEEYLNYKKTTRKWI